MSDVPYDVVKPITVEALTGVTLVPFLNTPVLLKRQISSSVGTASLDELVATCPLNQVQNANVPAGCLSGIYNNYCRDPFSADLLGKCHAIYEQVFRASVFKPLVEVCPAWKFGPRSQKCVFAISSFRAIVSYGDGRKVALGKTQAQELVNTIFASRTFAPCVAPAPRCNW
jgi:hypothetical protein